MGKTRIIQNKTKGSEKGKIDVPNNEAVFIHNILRDNTHGVGKQCECSRYPFCRGSILPWPNRLAPSKPGKYTKDRILIKLKPNVELRQLGEARTTAADQGFADELGKHGIALFKQLFPRAVSPKKGDFVALSKTGKVQKPDMSLWHVAELPDGADALKVATELSKSETYSWRNRTISGS